MAVRSVPPQSTTLLGNTQGGFGAVSPQSVRIITYVSRIYTMYKNLNAERGRDDLSQRDRARAAGGRWVAPTHPPPGMLAARSGLLPVSTGLPGTSRVRLIQSRERARVTTSRRPGRPARPSHGCLAMGTETRDHLKLFQCIKTLVAHALATLQRIPD